MMRGLSLLVAFCGACCVSTPPGPDMGADAEYRMPRDLATTKPDLAGSDMSTECIACNALINPCPALGLYCDGRTGCCDSNPH